jgi:molybdopterin synthase sulfur carrier subunit
LPAGVTTIGGLRAHLKARGGAYEQAFAERRLVRMAVNQDMVQQTAGVKAGDEVAFFPPVTGG